MKRIEISGHAEPAFQAVRDAFVNNFEQAIRRAFQQAMGRRAKAKAFSSTEMSA
jgi:hypothetical protein